MKKLEATLPNDAFVPNLVEIGQVVLDKKSKMSKHLFRRRDRQTNVRQNVIIKSSFEPGGSDIEFKIRYRSKIVFFLKINFVFNLNFIIMLSLLGHSEVGFTIRKANSILWSVHY